VSLFRGRVSTGGTARRLPDLIAHGENVGGRENISVTHSISFDSVVVAAQK
jgi:hypothetical protein